MHAPSAMRMSLTGALLVYEDGYRGSAYVSSHEIVRGPRGPQLGAGRPLEKQQLRALLANAGKHLGLRGWVSERVLFVAPDMIAWWRPSSPATMFFKAGAIDKRARQGVAMQPALVFAVARARWYVWATKCGAERPGPDAPLFQTPYLNVYEDGAICEGDVRVPKTIEPETTAQFERAFFESRFTHPNAGRLCEYEGGAAALWRSLLEQPASAFPEASLLPTDETLGQTLKRLAENEENSNVPF